MIRVGVNGRALGKPDPAGVSRYTRNLLEAIGERDPDEFRFRVFGVDPLPATLQGYDAIESAGVSPPSHSGPRAHAWEQLDLARALPDFDLDVFHTPAGQPPVLAARRVALVTTVHDISPVRRPEWFSRGYAGLYRVLTPLGVWASTRVVTVSAFTREEVVTAYPRAAAKTTAVHNGVVPPADPGTPVESVDGTPFVLFVGGANRRKNLAGLVSAYREYRRGVANPVALALAGPERDVFAAIEYDPPDGVHTLGYVTDDELGWLYRNASAFVYPALYEGFGLPIVEAMHAGTPVITSDRGAMAEVAGDAAHLVDPHDTSEIAAAIERVTSTPAYRNTLIGRGAERAASFTWERAAERTLAVYRDAAGR